MNLSDLQNAVRSAVAIRCRSKLQPAAGPGTKVFPPTHAGGVYATETRRIPDAESPGGTREAQCVLLDSVQSQANRIEDALQLAIDQGELAFPLISVEFGSDVPDIQRVTSLQAPHRAADAILRDSLLGGVAFRQSLVGKAITDSSLSNATAMFQYCPHALVLGIWDSTGPKGGLGAKFARALVSEVVGIDANYGVRTGSRIDPLQIAKQAGPLFRTSNGGWTLDPNEAIKELVKGKETGKVLLYKKVQKKDVYFDPIKQAGEVPDAGKPSAANHGNVTPDIGTYEKSLPSRDPLASQTQTSRFKLEQTSEGVSIRSSTDISQVATVTAGQVAAGGATIAYAEHTAVLSLPQLRRLRFPINGTLDKDVDEAARTLLAAIALVGLTLSIERGCDLRSRCLLFPESELVFQLLQKPGKPDDFTLTSADAIKLYNEAADAAVKAGLPWDTKVIELTPSPQLVALVKKSQELAAVSEASEE